MVFILILYIKGYLWMKNVCAITSGSSDIGLESANQFKDGIVVITGRSRDKLINPA